MNDNLNELKDFDSWSDDKKEEYRRLINLNSELNEILTSLKGISSKVGFAKHIELYYKLKSQGKIE